MQILTNHLKAVLLAAGKKDIRYYLNGVHMTQHHLVATDGYRMHIVCHGGDWPHGPVTIPRDACALAVKGKTVTLEITPTAIKLVAGRGCNSLARIGTAWVWSNPTLQVVVMPYRVHATPKSPASYSLEALSC